LPKFLFYGGKGGVGKTTCAAARATAETSAGRRVLVISTDPAHSLGDALAVRLSARVSKVRVKAEGSLHAVELDAPLAFRGWRSAHREALGDILEQGTWLDRDDADALLGLPMPGVDELIALLEIVRLAHGRSNPRKRSAVRPDAYDVVVVDTAPTGHTLRLLAAPKTVGAVARVLDALGQEHRLVREQLAGTSHPEAADRLVARLTEQARETGRLLRDTGRCSFHWVLTPEAMSLAESKDGLQAIEASGLRVAEIVVNRVLSDGPPCPMCDRRRTAEGAVLGEIVRFAGRSRIRVVPEESREPRGFRALAAIGQRLAAAPERFPARKVVARRRWPAHLKSGQMGISVSGRRSAFSLKAFDRTQLIVVCGKGGVGKTTTAAALAIVFARARPDRETFLLSTDPAHSLGDVLGARVGNAPTGIVGAPSNLRVRELDAAVVFASKRSSIEKALGEVAEALGAVSLSSSPGAGIGELMKLAPPGIDELFGLISVADLVAPRAKVDRGPGTIVVDTAPTGHALRLLAMPDDASEWVRMLMRVLLKYRQVMRPGRLADELLDLSRSIRALGDLLRDAARTRFVVVTRAAQLPRVETGRLLQALRRLRVHVPFVVVNALTLAPGSCANCRRRAAAERREIARLARVCRRTSRECAIIQAPLAAPPPRGVDGLIKWATTWIEEPTSTV
jgi:arsenite-transporting ATPase